MPKSIPSKSLAPFTSKIAARWNASGQCVVKGHPWKISTTRSSSLDRSGSTFGRSQFSTLGCDLGLSRLASSEQRDIAHNKYDSDGLSGPRPRPRTTFKPASASETDDYAHRPADDELSSFLQQKGRSVMKRRAEAISLTSMTNAEKAAFDGIWEYFDPASSPLLHTQFEPKQVDHKDTDLRNLLALFDLPTSRNTSDHGLTDAETLKDDIEDNTAGLHTAMPDVSIPDLPKTQRINQAALALVEDVSSSLDRALQASPTSAADSSMWQICGQKVFPLIKLLTPTQSKMILPSPTSLAEPPQPATPTHPLIPPDIPFMPVLSKAYPAALLLALRLFERHCPTSPYCLALLPHIKDLGPISYVLGANTHFYNTLISIKWDIYSDLDEISQLLAEMDRTGLEYNAGTADLLKRIALERDQDLRHEPYDTAALQMQTPSQSRAATVVPRERGARWWEKPLIDRSWTRLQGWRDLVTRRLEAQGLGEVMREGDSSNFETGDARFHGKRQVGSSDDDSSVNPQRSGTTRSGSGSGSGSRSGSGNEYIVTL